MLSAPAGALKQSLHEINPIEPDDRHRRRRHPGDHRWADQRRGDCHPDDELLEVGVPDDELREVDVPDDALREVGVPGDARRVGDGCGASRAIQPGRPNQNRAASESRTDTSRAHASRRCTSNSDVLPK